MKINTTAALLLAAALVVPAAVRANEPMQTQGGTGINSPQASQPSGTAGTSAPSSISNAEQGGAGTTGGTLESGAAAQKLKGTISSVDAANNAITLQTAEGLSQVVPVPQSAQIKSKASSSKQLSFADLKAGQKVNVQFDAAGAPSEIWVEGKSKAK